MGHAFANSDSFFFILTYVAIFLGAVIGPGIAMALYGGKLADGEDTKPWMRPVIRLSAFVNKRFHFDNTAFRESSLAIALENRLYIDEYYDKAMLNIVAGFSNKVAEADTEVIDGTIKAIESGSQSLSSVVRSLTTGSARDYILMVAVGTLTISLLIWGVA